MEKGMAEEEMTCPSYSRVEMQVNSAFAVRHKLHCFFLSVSAFAQYFSASPRLRLAWISYCFLIHLFHIYIRTTAHPCIN